MKLQQKSLPSERVNVSHETRFATGKQLPSQTQAWLIQTGVVKTYTWNEQGEALILGYWGKGELVGPCLSVVRPYQMQCRTPVVAQPVMPQDFSQLAGVLS